MNTTSSRESVNNLSKDVKKMSKAFITFDAQLQSLNEDESDLYDSKNEDEVSYFEISDSDFGTINFQFAQLDE